MAKKCPITGAGPLAGNNVSHANNRTPRRQVPNLQVKRLWLESERRFVRMRVSTRALRTFDKNGLENTLNETTRK